MDESIEQCFNRFLLTHKWFKFSDLTQVRQNNKAMNHKLPGSGLVSADSPL